MDSWLVQTGEKAQPGKGEVEIKGEQNTEAGEEADVRSLGARRETEALSRKRATAWCSNPHSSHF